MVGFCSNAVESIKMDSRPGAGAENPLKAGNRYETGNLENVGHQHMCPDAGGLLYDSEGDVSAGFRLPGPV